MSYHDEFGPDLTPEELEVDIIARLPELLRSRCCRNEDHCGPDPAVDHGHTDCWFMGLAAREIERLRDRTFWDRVAKGRVRPSTSKPERW